jgi:hypothetical protein
MAKGLRSSVKKTNRTKLRARVFEPVETARLERLHAKLLETAQQPKPENPKSSTMDVDSEGTFPPHSLFPRALSDPSPADATAAKEDEFSKGLSFLTAAIPDFLHATPPSSPTLSDAATSPPTDNTPATEEEDPLFYHFLGLCTDVVGFTPNGALEFAFDPHTPHWLSEQGLTV